MPGPVIAYFISPHGFGHAARSAAVLEGLYDLTGNARVEIFTSVPRWFFADSLRLPYGYHEVVTDVGLVQQSALEEDPAATVAALDGFWSGADRLSNELAERLDRLGASVVVADIAPLGLRVARRAGLPSVLVENFTWDWIYAGYVDVEPRLQEHAERFAAEFDRADRHLQTAPFCAAAAGAVELPPVARRPQTGRGAVRRRLGLEEDETRPVVLVTMGGISWSYTFVERLRARDDVVFVVPGAAEEVLFDGNLRLLPHHSEFYHPDLVAAVDLVVGKLGYSTVAEAYRAGVPFAFVERPRFRESEVLARFVEAEFDSLRIGAGEFDQANWVDEIGALARSGLRQRSSPNGAGRAAEVVLEIARGRIES